MNAADIAKLTQDVVTYAGEAADFVGVIDPALLPYIAIGKAVAEQIPGIEAHVSEWITGSSSGTDPSPQSVADFQAKLAVLKDPGGL